MSRKDGCHPLTIEQIWGEPECRQRGVSCAMWDAVNAKCCAKDGCVKTEDVPEDSQ